MRDFRDDRSCGTLTWPSLINVQHSILVSDHYIHRILQQWYRVTCITIGNRSFSFFISLRLKLECLVVFFANNVDCRMTPVRYPSQISCGRLSSRFEFLNGSGTLHANLRCDLKEFHYTVSSLQHFFLPQVRSTVAGMPNKWTEKHHVGLWCLKAAALKWLGGLWEKYLWARDIAGESIIWLLCSPSESSLQPAMELGTKVRALYLRYARGCTFDLWHIMYPWVVRSPVIQISWATQYI